MAFDASAWLLRFPEFTGRVTTGQITAVAEEAPLVFPIARLRSAARQAAALDLAVAHLLQMRISPSGTGLANMSVVGRVTDATQGSVHVGFDAGNANTLTRSFYMSTRYGQLLWLMVAWLVRMRYARGWPRQHPLFNPVP
jgi:hypothetical protein